MNDKYNSEHNLKSKFDAFQFSFDDQAFEKFQLELDKKKKKKNTFWWMGFVLLLGAVFAVCLTTMYTSTEKSNKLKSSKLSLNNKTTNPESGAQEAINPIVIEIDNIDKTKSTDNQKIDSKKLGKESTKSISADNYKKIQDLHSNNTIATKTEKKIGSFSQNSITTNKSGDDLFFSALKSEKDGISNQTELQKSPKNKVNNDRKSTLLNLVSIPSSIDFGILERMQEYRPEIPGNAIKPYVKPFDKYFYFNLRAGMIINDNFGSYDPYLSILKSKEFAVSAALAFQFSPDYAIELSYTRQTFSFGYYMKDASELRKMGGHVNIIRGALVSKLWSPFGGLQLNMTNGLSIMTNSNLDFGKGVSGFDTPDFISEALLTRSDISTAWHYMYSAGLEIDFPLSKNLACTLASEYTLGFKQLSESQLTYIEGEGVNKSVEAFSNGSFYSFTLGMKYRFE